MSGTQENEHMEHRSADWTEGTDPGSPPRADGADGTGSRGGEAVWLAGESGAVARPGTGESGAVARPGTGESEAVPRPGTGEPRVDAALGLLDRLASIPVSEHPGLYEQVHAQLSEVLGELDTEPGS
jgi:hypothetical protein